MNKPAILALTPLLTAVAFEATLLAAGFCSTRVGDLAPTRNDRIPPADRQFLIALEEHDRKASQVTMEDRALLAELQAKELELVPRATFVATPRSAPLAAPASATSEIPDASIPSLIPRATFVAPPRFASRAASDSATSAMQSAQTTPARRAEAVSDEPTVAARRSPTIIFNGKVFITTRPTVMN